LAFVTDMMRDQSSYLEGARIKIASVRIDRLSSTSAMRGSTRRPAGRYSSNRRSPLRSIPRSCEAIADFRVPGFKIDPYVMTQTVEMAWDNGAVISGIVELSWTQEGKHQQRLIRVAHVWAKRRGAWQMTYTQVTRVPQ